MSVDNKERHRGSDEGDAPLLGDGEGAAEEGEVVIGGEEGDQADGKAAGGSDQAKAIEARPGAFGGVKVWRGRGLLAVRWRADGAGGGGHGLGWREGWAPRRQCHHCRPVSQA
ncbi:MAG: hypothetical protein FJ083_13360 [Cyanobacteria bacterium K_Offshore_surface_m2_239]|nr:hypothetical protein [Cyanobacteria bacterium K_Offshore_surface_m2_239]